MEELRKQARKAPEPSGKLTVGAVITRRDGTVEDLGIISEGWIDFGVSYESPESGGRRATSET